MKALVLAGGFPQIALIEELKSRGITVVLADWNDEPVAKKFADKYYQVSTLDLEAIESVAKEEQVDFIVTVCTDQALHSVAYVSEKLGLPCYIDYETALNVTNKAYMKKVFTEHGISTADIGKICGFCWCWTVSGTRPISIMSAPAAASRSGCPRARARSPSPAPSARKSS